MWHEFRNIRTPYILVIIPALGGIFAGLVAYLAPFGNTGVDGTLGALLGLVGAFATVLGATLALFPKVQGSSLLVLNVLTLLAASLTAVAAYFLMQHLFATAMAVAFVGLVAALLIPVRRSKV